MANLTKNDPIMTVSDLRKELKIGRDAAYSLMNNSDFPSFAVSANRKRVRKSDLYEYMGKKVS